MARFGFHVLVIPLIYSTIANSVTASTIGNYWFVIVAAFFVLGVSFVTATLIALPFRLKHTSDFATLRIAATFPNIVALPILVFPSLCEYKVVYDAFGDTNKPDLYASCVANANTMIFLYFFAWSLLFWSFGYRHVMAMTSNNGDGMVKTIWRGIKQTLISPGFIAMILGFLTALVPPLQQALFDAGGYLRFLGAAVQTLGVASSPISTMVVAASLVPPTLSREHQEENGEGENHVGGAIAEECNDDGDEEAGMATDDSSHTHCVEEEEPSGDTFQGVEENESGEEDVEESSELGHHSAEQDDDSPPGYNDNEDDIAHESPIMSDPNFGPNQFRRRSSVYRFRQSIRRNSRRILANRRPSNTLASSEMRKLLVWFILSRLVVTPAL